MIPIESQNNPDEVISRIWFFGTGRDNCLGMGGMDCIRRDQIEWFREESSKIDKDDVHRGNGIAFMSTPLQEHMYLVNNFSVRGNKRDYSSCQALNTGFFASAKQAGTISWISTGTDHNTDFWGSFDGINLGYGRKTGVNSYGPKFEQKGARVFKMTLDETSKEKATWETWIR